MRLRRIHAILLVSSLMLSSASLHARYLMPTMDRVLSTSNSIADVTVTSFDKHGNARLIIHEELKGKQPELVTGVSLSCYPLSPKRTGMKVGQRYLVICRNGLLYEGSTQYEIRLRDGVVECLFPRGNNAHRERCWTPLENIRKQISQVTVKKG